MYGFLSKLIISKQLKFNEGEIVLFGEPIAFMPMASLFYMTKDAIKNGKKAINDLYYYGWVYGYVLTLAMVKKFGLRKFEERYKVSMDIASLCGFGDYKTLDFVKGHSNFKVLKNPFALEFYPSKNMVDHYLRGMNAGGGSLVHMKIINCIEFECAAKNGSYCRFENLDKKRLDKVDKKLVDSQLDYKYLLKKQKTLIEDCKEKVEDYEL